MSYPSTGSTGDGYQWAQDAGLKVTALLPALVPFEAAELETVKSLQGLSLKMWKQPYLMAKRTVS